MQVCLKLFHILNGLFSLGTITFFISFSQLKITFISLIMQICVCVWVGESECNDPEEARRHPRELELQALVSSLTRVLGTELRSSGRAVSAISELFLQPLFFLIQPNFA